jgi:hypothetical protein
MANLRIGEDTRARIAQAWPGLLSRIAGGGLIGRELQALGVERDSVRAYMASTQDARKEWDEAREASADAFFEDAVEITYNSTDPKLARAQVDALLRFAARRDPRRYSERQTLDVNVRAVDLTRIISEANARLAAREAGRVIEGTVLPALLSRGEG